MSDFAIKNSSQDSVGYYSDESNCQKQTVDSVTKSSISTNSISLSNAPSDPTKIPMKSMNNNNNNSEEARVMDEVDNATHLFPASSKDNLDDSKTLSSTDEQSHCSTTSENQLASATVVTGTTTAIGCTGLSPSTSSPQSLFSTSVPPSAMINPMSPAASALYFRGYDYAMTSGVMPQYSPTYNYSSLLGPSNSYPYLRINASAMPVTSPQYWNADPISLQSSLLASGVTGFSGNSVPVTSMPTTVNVGLNQVQPLSAPAPLAPSSTHAYPPLHVGNLTAHFSASVQLNSESNASETHVSSDGSSGIAATSSQQVSIPTTGSSASSYTPPISTFPQHVNVPNIYNASGTPPLMGHNLPWNMNFNPIITQALLNNYWHLLNAGSHHFSSNPSALPTASSRAGEMATTGSEPSISSPEQTGASTDGHVSTTTFKTGDTQRDERLTLLRKVSFFVPSYQIPPTVPCARFFVIKSFNEDDVHRSIKYDIWCSTERGNGLLHAAYQDMEQRGGHVYLLFSVNGSGHFCGMCRMTSGVDFQKRSAVWSRDKWTGEFKVSWLFVKDVPNQHLRHIRLECNENKPVTNSRDCTEILPLSKALQVVNVMIHYVYTSSLLDDFDHYEEKELPNST